MAWLFGDSFDTYLAGQLDNRWQLIGGNAPSGAVISTGTGRDGTNSLRLTVGSGEIGRGVTPATPDTCIWGFAWRTNEMSVQYGLTGLWNAVFQRGHVLMVVNVDGSITAWRQGFNEGYMQWGVWGAPLGTTPASLLLPNTWHHLQFRVKIHASLGEVEIRIDGVPQLVLTNQNTANSGDPAYTLVTLGADSAYAGERDIDDLWILDASGPAPWNSFIGDLIAEAVFPTAPGASTGWTPNTGANWQCVDDRNPDDDTTVVTAETVGTKDTYQHGPLLRINTGILAVQTATVGRKTTAGSRTICHVTRVGTTDYDSTPPMSLPSDYAAQLSCRVVNPATSAQWTAAQVDATEIGMKVVG